MKTLLWLGLILGAWVVLNAWILPKLGIRT